MAVFKYINPGIAYTTLYLVNKEFPKDDPLTPTKTGYCFTSNQSTLNDYSLLNIGNSSAMPTSISYNEFFFTAHVAFMSTDDGEIVKFRFGNLYFGFKKDTTCYFFTPNNSTGVALSNIQYFTLSAKVYIHMKSSTNATTNDGILHVSINGTDIIDESHSIYFVNQNQDTFAYVRNDCYLSHIIFSNRFFSPREEIFEVPIESTTTSFKQGVNFCVAPYVKDFILQKPNANRIKAISPAHSKITGYAVIGSPAYRNADTPAYLQTIYSNSDFLLDDLNRKWFIKGNPTFHMFGRTGSCINTANGFIYNNSDSLLTMTTFGWIIEWFDKIDSVPNSEQKIICGENNCQIAYSVDIHYDGVNPEPRVSIGDSTLDKWCINNVPIGDSILNQWVLRTVERYNNTIYCFQNGALVASYDLPTSSYNIRKPSHWFIGGCFRDPEFHFNGFISQVIFSNSPRTPTNFTVTEDALRRLNTGEGSLHFETALGNAQPFWTDSKNNVWFSKGSPLPSVAPDGTRALRLHQSSIYTNKSLLSLGSEDFTIEWYDFRTVAPNQWTSIALTIANTPYQIWGDNKYFQIVNTDKVYLWLKNSSNQTQNDVLNAGLARSAWCHRAFSRSGNFLYGFENGQLVSKVDLASIGFTDLKPGNSTVIGYGDDLISNPGWSSSYIYLTDFRFTDKLCRYTTNFTPPALGSLSDDEFTTSILTFGSDSDPNNTNPIINSIAPSITLGINRLTGANNLSFGVMQSFHVEQSIDDFSKNSYGWKVTS